MPKAGTRGGKAAEAAEPMDTAVDADAPPPPLADVAPMPLFPPLSAADLAGGKVEWRKARAPPVPAYLVACSAGVQRGCAGRQAETCDARRLAGDSAAEPHDTAEEFLAGALHARDGEDED
jgi:hypothetical protein